MGCRSTPSPPEWRRWRSTAPRLRSRSSAAALPRGPGGAARCGAGARVTPGADHGPGRRPASVSDRAAATRQPDRLGSARLGSGSIIGVAELTYQTQSIGSSTFRYFGLFTIAALFYIACAQLISLVWRLLNGRAAHAPLGLLLLLKGLAITLELSLGSLVLGSLGGIVLGAMRSSEWRILKAVALVYIEAVRSIPFCDSASSAVH